MSDLDADGNKIERVRIVMVGETNVGKTEFCNCFKTQVFSGTTVATIGVGFTSVEMHLHLDATHRVHARVELYDTAGQERYGGQMTRTYYRIAQGMIIMFDPSVDESVSRAIKLYQQITEDVPDIVAVFVANKLDVLALAGAERTARLAKLETLFKSAERARPPSATAVAVAMAMKSISLKQEPKAALDIIGEMSRMIVLNKVALKMRRDFTNSRNDSVVNLQQPTGETRSSNGKPSSKKRLQRQAAYASSNNSPTASPTITKKIGGDCWFR
jgi:small GTP-binding protein